MYGSIFHMKAKPGQEQKIIDQFKSFEKNRRPIVDGMLGGLVMTPDDAPGTVIGVAVFRDKASYRANADDPA